MTDERAAWQRGHALADLKQYAAVFAACHKPLVFGAFGLTNERDIAEALEAGSLVWKRGGDSIIACAIAKPLRRTGGFATFTGEEIEVPWTAVRVSAFACTDIDAGEAILRAIIERAGPRPVYVEAFEEDDTARCALARVGLCYIATKIAAGSEVKGLYCTNKAEARELDEAERASLAIIAQNYASADECAAIIAEAESVAWAQHYSSYNKGKSWTAFALRGYDEADPTFIIKPAEMSKQWKAANPTRLQDRCAWTVGAAQFPKAVQLAQRVIGNRAVDRVRLMRLSKGGELTRHADVTDRDAGVADGKIARLHIPLRTSAGVVFNGWDKRGAHIERNFPQGALCYLDQRGPHSVQNNDPNVDRVHLVIDVASDADLRAAIAAATNESAPA